MGAILAAKFLAALLRIPAVLTSEESICRRYKALAMIPTCTCCIHVQEIWGVNINTFTRKCGTFTCTCR